MLQNDDECDEIWSRIQVHTERQRTGNVPVREAARETSRPAWILSKMRMNVKEISESEKKILLKKYLDSLWKRQHQTAAAVRLQQPLLEEQHIDTDGESSHVLRNNINESNYYENDLISVDELLMCYQFD